MAIAYQDLLGLRYEKGAAPPAGTDCWSLVREWFARAGVVLPRDPLGVDANSDAPDVRAAVPRGWMRADRPYLIGDVLTFAIDSPDGVADHVGVIAGPELLLHATEKQGVLCEPVYRAARRFRLVSHLRRIERVLC